MVFRQLMEGESLRAAARRAGVAPSTILKWVGGDAHLAQQYSRAKMIGDDLLFDEILELGNAALHAGQVPETGASRVQGIRVQIEAIKWVLARRQPKKYGDRIDVTAGSSLLEGMTPEQAEAMVKRVFRDPGVIVGPRAEGVPRPVPGNAVS